MIENNECSNKIFQKKGEVRKHNDFIRCTNNLTTIQRKAFAFILSISIVHIEKNGFSRYYQEDLAVFKEIFGYKTKNHKWLREELRELKKKEIVWGIDNEGNGTFANMLSSFDITDGVIRWGVAPHLEDKILENGYTPLKFKILSSLISKYSIALYENISTWKQRKWIEFSIEEFKILMGINNDKAYNNNKNAMFNLKARVLTPALKEINEKSDLKVFCNDKKKGVKITGFRFEFTVLTTKEIKEREQYLINTEICIKALKKTFGNKYRINEKWFILKKEGLVYRGKVLYNLVEAVEKIHNMKKLGILKKEDIQEVKS